MKNKIFLTLCLPLFLAVGCGEPSKEEETKEFLERMDRSMSGGEMEIDGKKMKIPSALDRTKITTCIRFDDDSDGCMKLFNEYAEYTQDFKEKLNAVDNKSAQK